MLRCGPRACEKLERRGDQRVNVAECLDIRMPPAAGHMYGCRCVLGELGKLCCLQFLAPAESALGHPFHPCLNWKLAPELIVLCCLVSLQLAPQTCRGARASVLNVVRHNQHSLHTVQIACRAKRMLPFTASLKRTRRTAAQNPSTIRLLSSALKAALYPFSVTVFKHLFHFSSYVVPPQHPQRSTLIAPTSLPLISAPAASSWPHSMRRSSPCASPPAA